MFEGFRGVFVRVSGDSEGRFLGVMERVGLKKAMIGFSWVDGESSKIFFW